MSVYEYIAYYRHKSNYASLCIYTLNVSDIFVNLMVIVKKIITSSHFNVPSEMSKGNLKLKKNIKIEIKKLKLLSGNRCSR